MYCQYFSDADSFVRGSVQKLRIHVHNIEGEFDVILYCGTQANSADPDQTLHLAPNQGLHCLLKECSIKNVIESEQYHPTTLKMEIDWSNW